MRNSSRKICSSKFSGLFRGKVNVAKMFSLSVILQQ